MDAARKQKGWGNSVIDVGTNQISQAVGMEQS